jgi:hypothetical protein
MRARLLTLVLIAAAAVAAAPAGASPQSDFTAVYGDWKPDLAITPCRWTQPQLQNAYNVANSNPDFQYETRFSNDLQTEISRWRKGGCAGVAPFSERHASPLYSARIVKVSGKGGAAKEVVQLRNVGTRTLSFRKASLRNLAGSKAVFPGGFKLAKGRTAVVHVGCTKGKGRASFTARTVWLCRRSPLFGDRGDVARLADAKGVIVTQLGYGTQKRRAVF